jgi:hypothetical protein
MHPGIICGEIVKEDEATSLAGYFPPETVVVKQTAQAIGAEFFASDWRGDYLAMIAAEEAMTQEEREQFAHSHDQLIAALPIGTNQMFEFLHGGAQPLIETAHNLRMALGTEVADGYWLARNQMIIKQCMRRSQQLGLSKILFAFGIEHKYLIEKYLQEQYAVTALPLVQLFSPSNDAASDDVISEWSANLAGLETMMSGANTPAYQKEMIQASGRIGDLRAFIANRGRAMAN